MKKLLIALVALFVLAMVPSAMAAMSVDVNGASDSPVSVVRGEIIPVKVTFDESLDYQDVTIEVQLRYEHSKKVEVSSTAKDVVAGVYNTKTLYIEVPSDIEITAPGDYYALTVQLKDGNGYELEWRSFDVMVQRTDDQLQIQNVLKPLTIEAGKTFTANVVVKNTGSDRMDDVYVRMSIPELGLSTEARAGDLLAVDTENRDDTHEVPLSLVIPGDATKGTYTLEIEASNNDAKTIKKDTIVVSGVDSTTGKATSATADKTAKNVAIDPLLVTAVILAIVLVVLVIVFVKTRKGENKLEEESYY